MTLQVALVGTDGIVLASYKKNVLRGSGLVSRRTFGQATRQEREKL
jgi:hypothetical protein